MKKQQRLENKKRKTVALAKIMEINDNDKKPKKASIVLEESAAEEALQDEEPLNKRTKMTEVNETENKFISDDQYKELRKDLASRLNALKNVPQFRLKFFGEQASLLRDPQKRVPLILDDIQYLLMSALLGSNSPFKPDRWCVLEKASRVTHTVILVIEGITAYNFTANESLFVHTKGIFEQQLEVKLPKYQKNRIIEELSCVPLTQTHKEKLIKEYGSLEAAINMNKDHNFIAKSVFPIDGDVDNSAALPAGEMFPRTRLLLSPLQMMIEGYPMPLKGEFEDRYRDYKFTKSSYKPVTSMSPMFGLDCEMCRTIKAENELARVSIVDENHHSVYETLVRPDNKIANYLTPWSGITKEMMTGVTKTLKEVQKEVCKLLPSDAILVGQSLNCDLNAMKLMHPYVIDTSVIFNVSGDRNRKAKLQLLAKSFLGEEIQTNKTGHSSIEDSTACLKLTKLKLSRDIYYGDVAMQTKRQVVETPSYTGIAGQETNQQHVATTIFSQALKRRKKSAIITTHNSSLDLSRFYSNNQFNILHKDAGAEGDSEKCHGIKHHQVQSASKVVNKTREVIIENDFNLSHFNIFEDSLNEDYCADGNCESSSLTDEEKIEKIIPKIDEWIETIWHNVATNGLFVVIFGGNEKSANGLSMIRIKR